MLFFGEPREKPAQDAPLHCPVCNRVKFNLTCEGQTGERVFLQSYESMMVTDRSSLCLHCDAACEQAPRAGYVDLGRLLPVEHVTLNQEAEFSTPSSRRASPPHHTSFAVSVLQLARVGQPTMAFAAHI